MKIVQSFWSKPSKKKSNFKSSDRHAGGWLDKKSNFMSWALSCLQFKKYYDCVELVTDKNGYEILINRLQLPYTDVKIVLDDLKDYHHDLWALGKLYTYGIQDKPFIHADADIYVWEAFDNRINNSKLVAQNIERGFSYYGRIFDNVTKTFNFVPDILLDSQKSNGEIIAVNAGILGGTDLDFFKNYSKTAIEFVERNRDSWDKVNIGLFNTVFEQFLFHALAEQRKIGVEFLLNDVNHTFDGLAELLGAPKKTKFVHTVGAYKRQKQIGDLVAFRMQMDHPEYYYRIIRLLRSYQI